MQGRAVDHPSLLHVIAIGSPLSSDDAVGLQLLQRLAQDEWDDRPRLSAWSDMDALTLTHELLSMQGSVVFVDAMNMGLTPGSHRFFSSDQCRMRVQTDSVSTHGFGLADGIEMARQLGFTGEIWLFGVQPFDLSPGTRLSHEMSTLLPDLTVALRESILSLGRSARGAVPEFGARMNRGRYHA